MHNKPTYEKLEQKVKALEQDLAQYQGSTDPVSPPVQYLRTILDSTNQPVFLKNSQFNYIFVNRAYEELVQVSQEQIRGKDDFAFFPKEFAEKIRAQDQEVKQHNRLAVFKQTNRFADGEHTFLTTKFPLHDAAGTFHGVGCICTDITPLQKAENTLRESEQRYRSFIDNFHGIAYRGDIHTFTPVFFHGAVEEITGYREEEFVAGRPRWDQVVHPDDLPLLVAEEEKIQQLPDYSFRREYRIIRKDGEVRWIFEQARVLADAQNRPAFLEGSLFDITGRKIAEKALSESEEKYRKLFTNEIDAIVIFDVATRQILDVNDAFLKLYGYSRDEVLRLKADDMSAEPEQTKADIQKSSAQGETLIPFRRHKKKDGTEIIVQLSAGPYTWMGRTVMYSILRDITDQIRAEQALKASEQKFKSIVDGCPEGIHLYMLQPDGRLIFTGVNPAADAILQVDCAQFIGKTIEEAFSGLSESEVPDRFREVCRTGEPWRVEQIDYADEQIQGTFAIQAFQTAPTRMAVFFRDLTVKLRMEQELQKMQKLESVGILAGGIAHDFNNLLTAILGNISMAKLFAQTDQGKVLERLIDAEKASLRARDLTQQLLTFAKGGAPVKNTAFISEVIRDSTSFMLSGSNVRCNLLLPDDLWPVEIDLGQISQVIQNVVKNGEQAMPEGGSITILAANTHVDDTRGLPLQPGNYIHLAITDQGVGIPKKHLARIFDPYFSTKQEGSGLGLAACYSIINNHDGLIFAESEYGAGATFHLYLPASESRPEPKAVARKRSLCSGEHILIMDDDDDVLQVAVNMLNLMGYRTAIAHDGAEAIVMYKQAMHEGQPFDGVLLDLTIPGGMGGRETVKQLATLDPEIKAIVSSGYANDPIMADYSAHGFMGVVSKPYDMEHLGLVFRDLFER